jgi:hypothetical protein
MLAGSQTLEIFMQTSQFQIGLIAILAVGLGFSLASSTAVGYPAGAAVSMGSNPVWSMGGVPAATQTLTAPADQDMIITDVHFANTDSHWIRVEMALAGDTVAAFTSDSASNRLPVALQSGIRVPAGEALTIGFAAYYGLSSVRYTLSGYYAQP